jgi:DNA replicative helicase MCM subunit Mcm2 (Cdc46/Mcm family)
MTPFKELKRAIEKGHTDEALDLLEPTLREFGMKVADAALRAELVSVSNETTKREIVAAVLRGVSE